MATDLSSEASEPPIADDDAKQMLQFARRYGSANCWTGTTGTACKYILRLLKERNERKGIKNAASD